MMFGTFNIFLAGYIMSGAKAFVDFGIRIAGCLTLLSGTCLHAAQIDIEFSEFTAGQTFPNSTLPQTIASAGVDIELSKYLGSSGANGRIFDTQLFGMSNNALFLAANLRADIVLPAASAGGFFFFRNQGGTNLLEINGEQMNFTSPALAGSTFGTVGGVSVHSSPLTGNYRSVKLDGMIHSLAFIGQELSLDSIQLQVVPEPKCLLLVLMPTIFGIACRRSKRISDPLFTHTP